MPEEAPTEETKNKGSRPLKFKTVAELKHQIETYSNICDPHTEMRRTEVGTKQDGSTN